MLHIVAQRGFEQPFLDYFREVNADDSSACGRALKQKNQIVVADTEKEWADGDKAIARKSGFRSVQSTPLFASDGSPIGMISTHFKNPGIPDGLTLNRMELYSHKARSFIEKVSTHEFIKQQNLELEEKVNERTMELKSSLQREKELNELKSQFVSLASHEFRTPLSTILSSMFLIESYYKDEHKEKRDKHISRVKSSVNNLVDILDDFLSIDKLEQGKIEIVQEKFNLHEFAGNVLEEVNEILKQGQQTSVSYNGQKEIIQDRKILKNILLNLLSNAIKYSDEGKNISLSILVDDATVLIKVTDEGIGIPEEEQANLFSKFFRAKNTTDIQGTGLGLNIVKKYVELLDGTISFESKSNQGTTFIIEFPQNNS